MLTIQLLGNTHTYSVQTYKEQKLIRSHRLGLAVLMLLTPLMGCGGGQLSQADLKKYAIRRANDDDDDSKARSTPAQPTQPVSVDTPSASPTSTPQKSVPGSVKQSTTPTSATTLSSPASPTSPSTSTEGASGTSGGVSDTQSQPEQPLSPTEKRKRTVANMQRISEAILRYQQEKNLFPTSAIYDTSARPATPLLSWRVALLPYLGYEELYAQFDTKSPWYAPQNKALLDKIPSVYQSPERFDTKTNYLVPLGSSTAYGRRERGVSLRRFEDGVEDTVILLEVDDALAVDWIVPSEYEVNPQNPTKGLGTLRGGEFFVVWGSGLLGSVAQDSPQHQVAAMYSIDGGEIFSFTSINRPISLDGPVQASTAANAPSLDSHTGTTTATSVSTHTTIAHGPPARITHNSASANTSRASGLAGTYFAAAEAAYLRELMNDTLRWWLAGTVVADESVSWPQNYAYYSALDRIRPAIRIGIGVEYSGPEGLPEQNLSANPVERNEQNYEQVLRITQPFGDTLIEAIEDHASAVAPKWLDREGRFADRRDNGTNTTRRQRNLPLYATYLGRSTRSEMYEHAVRSACDVLVILEVNDTTQKTTRQVRWKMIDLESRDDFAQGPKMLWRFVGDQTPLDLHESYRNSLWKLRDTLADGLSPSARPHRLLPIDAERRVEALAKVRTINPLAVLSELTIYQRQQLIDNELLLRAYQQVLGESDGLTLMIGNDEKKRRVLRQWLPTEIPTKPATRRLDPDDD